MFLFCMNPDVQTVKVHVFTALEVHVDIPIQMLTTFLTVIVSFSNFKKKKKKKISIYHRWNLFCRSTDVNFQFTPKRGINEQQYGEENLMFNSR